MRCCTKPTTTTLTCIASIGHGCLTVTVDVPYYFCIISIQSRANKWNTTLPGRLGVWDPPGSLVPFKFLFEYCITAQLHCLVLRIWLSEYGKCLCILAGHHENGRCLDVYIGSDGRVITSITFSPLTIHCSHKTSQLHRLTSIIINRPTRWQFHISSTWQLHL